MKLQYDTQEFEEQFTYKGTDLGAVWYENATHFRVWAPGAAAVTVMLYEKGDGDCLIGQIPMTTDRNGTWITTAEGNLNGVYYTYLVRFGDQTAEACDPYARTTGINGHRAMILDLKSTNPTDWDKDADPHGGLPITDAVIYELHVRDLSLDESSGIKNKGKFLGLIEQNTKTPSGIPTGLSHMKALGITHLHILPMYDFGSVDEGDPTQFNWGYDPENFNVPEGAYSTDPYNGAVRIKELKQMVKALHDNGISVVMDVVYNHVYHAEDFCFNRIVPGYFSRPSSNGSFCGNDTATERAMVRKYIVDSVKYWAEEYHIDAFRFDLVGLIDVKTIQAVMDAVHESYPHVLFYGEGWTMPTHLTKEVPLTTQSNALLVPDFAFFSDNFRDMLRGSVLEENARGFVSGAPNMEKEVQNCYMAQNGWSNEPAQSIQYGSCHDNRTLYDQLRISAPHRDPVAMNKLSAALTLTAQGVPFFLAGEEFLRTKNGCDNSYNLPDSVNSLKWHTLESPECADMLQYYKGLIALRKAYRDFRLSTAKQIDNCVHSIDTGIPNTAAFLIQGEKTIFSYFNANDDTVEAVLPEGSWHILVNGEKAGTQVLGTVSGRVSIAPISPLILVQA